MKIKNIKKTFLLVVMLLSLAICGSVSAETTIPSTITIDQTKTSLSTDALHYIESNTGDWDDNIKTPMHYAFVNGVSIPVYCFERGYEAYNPDAFPSYSGVFTLNNLNEELSQAGYVYIALHGFPEQQFTGDDKKDYYITQIALWWYQDLLKGVSDSTDGIMPADFKSETAGNMTNYSDPEGLFGYIKTLAHAAAKASNPSVTLSLNKVDFSYNSDYSKFQATVKATTNGTLGRPTLIKDANVSNATYSGTSSPYKVTVPVDSLNGMTGSVTFKIGSTLSTKVVYLYKSSTPIDFGSKVLQKLFVPFDDTLSTEKSIKLTASKTGIRVSKVDESGKAVKGATLRLTDSSGNKIDEWVTDGTVKEIYNFKPGKVTLTEIKTPDGYTTMESITKEVTAGSMISINAINNKNEIEISKQDATTGEELPGATLVLKDSDGKVVEKWISSTEPHVVKGLKAGATYTLEETIAPDGYALTSSVKFTLNDEGKVDEPVIMKNEQITVKFYKKDSETKEMLAGSELVLKDSDGKEIERWISTTEPNIIKGLIAGETYTLEEVVAPEGYDKAEKVTFTVDSKKTLQEVTMYDRLTVIDVPNTGSYTSMILYISGALILLSGVIGITLYIKRRKSEQI